MLLEGNFIEYKIRPEKKQQEEGGIFQKDLFYGYLLKEAHKEENAKGQYDNKSARGAQDNGQGDRDKVIQHFYVFIEPHEKI